ncbi:Multidrug resistance-associated protein 4, partial [Cladochytrium tenue]
ESAMRLGQALMLGRLLDWFRNSGASMNEGFYLALGMAICAVGQAFVHQIAFFLAMRVGMQMRVGFIAAIYEKCLRLSIAHTASTGAIVNLVSNDVQRFEDATPFAHFLWLAPLEIIVLTYFVYLQISWAAFAAVFALLSLIPIQSFFAHRFGKIRKRTVAFRDERIKYAWEEAFAKNINSLRDKELNTIRSAKFFSLPDIKRERDEAEIAALVAEVGIPDSEIVIKDGSFAWGYSSERTPANADSNVEKDANKQDQSDYLSNRLILKDINIVVKKGQISAVIGPVGSGKSSLLNAILGEMDGVGKTRVALRSKKVAYCMQTSFIMSGTIRDNITFGQPYDGQWFKEVIAACAMERDLQLFSNGELTRVGERGVTLSGGQRARLALARAVYSKADVYLLDDPLSAVDTSVGRHLFEKCLTGILAGKTRVLVTHQLQFARRCDSCILLDGGRVAAQGNYAEILDSAQTSSFAAAIKELEAHPEAGLENDVDVDELVGGEKSKSVPVEDDSPAGAVSSKPPESSEHNGKLPPEGEERSSTGSISWRVYLDYFRSGASIPLGLFLFSLLVIGEVTLVGTDYFLSRWSLFSPADQRNVAYVGTFLAFGLGTLVISMGRAVMFFNVALNATMHLFRGMLHSVFRSPMKFFHDNPHGRLMNRFSKDLGLSDEMLPLTFFDFIQCAFMILGTLVIAVVVIPYILVSVPFIGVLFYYLRKYYLMTQRQIKRYEAVTRSPVYSNIPSTLEGLSTVRAFSSEKRFLDRFMDYQNENTRIFFCFLSSARWLGVRLDLLSAFFLAMIAFVAVGLRVANAGLSAGVVGLLLSYALQLMGLLQWAVRQSAEVENYMVSVERILEYTTLPSEAPSHTDVIPPENWPERGDVELRNMSLQYPSTPAPVLKNLAITFPAGAKIGVVGRTGAGKSSMLQALFRLVEPTPAGSIVIDGVETSKLGLADLRSRISIIPQEPFCFKGTLRYNIDPFGRYGDDAIWRALESVELARAVEKLPGRLDSAVEENGANWSVGERQLICLARATLRGSRLIVMDEATSAVDMRTDALVQRAVRSPDSGLFAAATVLTIAHRLQTVADFDRVLVLDAGQVVEFGPPHLLLAKRPDPAAGAWFAAMVAEMGQEAQDQVRAAAAAKYFGSAEAAVATAAAATRSAAADEVSVLAILPAPQGDVTGPSS